eukprot:CAMPEP_0195296202 /NCGR_PEP_ID=MMETSP0707-20130614/18964_1 /TAXON_ID=33640 /ORGANISM="Asterionellopsis glacialis, Strain CCMP134" /LENGTH=475 /DNA_ID=CAMNT_0040357637 /DNA_START=155 /DNA_END=1579 /DNA_ORIENTATION=-
MSTVRKNFFLLLLLVGNKKNIFALNLGNSRRNFVLSKSKQETKTTASPKLDPNNAVNTDESSSSSLRSMLSTSANITPPTAAKSRHNKSFSNKHRPAAVYASSTFLALVIGFSALANPPIDHTSDMNNVLISSNTARVMTRLEKTLLTKEPTKEELLQKRITEHALLDEKLAAQPAWIAYCAAMFASFGSTLVMHPIDTIKIGLQRKKEENDFDYSIMDLDEVVANQVDGAELVQNSLNFNANNNLDVYSREGAEPGLSFTPGGIAHLYKGISANLLKEGPPSALYLGIYETVKQFLLVPADGSQPAFSPLVVYLIAGGVGEIAGSMVRAPSTAAKIRLQSGMAATPVEAFQQVMENPTSVFNAWLVSSAGVDVPFGAINIAIFEGARTALAGWDMVDVHGIFGEALLGAVAGGTAAFLTCPGDVVLTRLVTQNPKGDNDDDQKRLSPLEMIKDIYAEGGVPIFFAGSISRTLYW